MVTVVCGADNCQSRHCKGHAMKHSGTVSHGTMRLVDLIPTFWKYVHEHNPDALLPLIRDDYDLYCGIVDSDSDFDLDVDEYADAGYLLEKLFDAMNDLAPEGYYFGAHPGDGSDYGFWEVDDDA